MNIKVKSIILVVAVVLALFSVGLCAFGEENIKTDPKISIISSQNQVAGYTLKEYRNNIAIFKDGNDLVPIKVFDIYFPDLPERDKTRLTEGIKGNSLEEIMGYLEDFE